MDAGDDDAVHVVWLGGDTVTTTFNAWQLSFCAAYLVPPCKGSAPDDAMAKLAGSPMDVARLPEEYFRPLFCEEAERHPIGVAFASEGGLQKNCVRDLVRGLAFGDAAEKRSSAESLALRLALATDKRSLFSLFLILVGVASDDRTRVLFWTFPANPSLRASMGQQGISIELIRDAFSRGGSFYKAAMFEGPQANTSFWQGSVEDHQAKSHARGVSDFWIVAFLSAQLEMKGPQGTRLVASMLRRLIDETTDTDIQQAAMNAAMTLVSQSDELMSLRQIAHSYLPAEIRAEFLGLAGSEPIVDAQFRIQPDVLKRAMKIRSITLDSGFTVRGPLESFDDVVHRSPPDPSGEVEISLRGTIRSERITMR